MAVKIGSARIDENGKTHGGKAGDQTGKEVSTQAWYKHKKGWRVLRCTDADKAEKIALAMQAACDNANIGYDQYQRDTLYNAAKGVDFDPARVKTTCETDCSALVRVCCAYAGITIGNFRTTNEARLLLASGAFTELTGSKYTDQSSYLRRGDVLVTKTQGHTVVVLSNGSKVEASDAASIGERVLRNGMTGEDVKQLQSNLISLGYDIGRWGVDGDFGDATEQAVRAFQTANACGVDGKVGTETRAALEKALAANTKTVKISGGNCYVRSAPTTSGKILGVAKNGMGLPYGGQTAENGWLLVEYENQKGWVSGKYGKLEG